MESKRRNKKRPTALSAFTIILILTFILALITQVLPKATFEGNILVNGSGVMRATLSQTLLAPILGFADAIDICLFVLVLGGFLKIINHTKAIETGIQVLIKKITRKRIGINTNINVFILNRWNNLWNARRNSRILCSTSSRNGSKWNGYNRIFSNRITRSRKWSFRFNY